MSIGSMNGIRRAFAFSASISASSSARRSSSQLSAISASSCAIVLRLRPPQRDPARHARAHGAADRDIRGRAGGRIAGALRALALGFRELALGEIRQFQIVEEQVDEFVARQDEPESVLAVALPGAVEPSAALTRARKHVALDEFLVSGKHHVARAAFAAKARLIHPVERNADLAAFQDVLDVAALRTIS